MPSRIRSAITGMFASAGQEAASPDTHVRETTVGRVEAQLRDQELARKMRADLIDWLEDRLEAETRVSGAKRGAILDDFDAHITMRLGLPDRAR